MNINRAVLPTVPCLIPQPKQSEEVASFVGQEPENQLKPLAPQEVQPPALLSPDVGCGVSTSHQGLPFEAPLPPLRSAITAGSTGKTSKVGLRSRYVLPPDVQTSCQNSANLLPQTVPVEKQNLPSISSEVFQPKSSSFSTLPIDPTGSSVSSTPVELSSTSASSFAHPAYKPAEAYWFYATNVDGNKIWWPFSRRDSYQLETESFRSRLPSPLSEDLLVSGLAKSTTVPVEGGRYDVDLTQRQRKLPDELRVLPFSETTCESLEAQYKIAMENGHWGQPFELPAEDPRGGSDRFIFHNPQASQ
ncbi:unnamed protein product [Echinostoma caproni]|uniref:WWE domain-containing protein n=1 Tax=Echinostoma caproni TaxID=27848 RepID=A0A183AGQ6_9TREM|nr:unnamed protein product [Echinostoma caproni]